MDWWKKEVIYQIYPRSFQDSNGDGVGDIPGIISRLDEIAELGVGAIWLSPVYVSPGADNGYDIADYRRIDPLFGTLKDMDRLIAGAAERGIGIIMDLVMNHTSDRHEWFQKSRRRIAPYDDYYIWRDRPNNWTGFFGGPTWEWDETRGQYYLHLFAKEQPDLNWRNPAVLAEMEEVIRFWLARGVKGFRCDVVNVLYKDSLARGRPRLILTGVEHYLGTEGFHETMRALKREAFGDCFTVGETVFTDTESAKLICAPEREELTQVFPFEHMECDQTVVKWFRKKLDRDKFFRVLAKWQGELGFNSLYLENHDQPRSVSRFGDGGKYRERSAKLLCTLLFTQRGTPFMYQGEELGMTNFDFTSMSELRDVESRNVWALAKRLGFPKSYRWRMIREVSRDNARTPYQWDATKNAGFTAGEPWLGVNKNYVNLNRAAQAKDPDSVLSYYKRMIALRAATPALLEGDFRLLRAENGVFAFTRSLGDETVTVALNMSGRSAACPVSGHVLIGNCGDGYCAGYLRPWEAVVLG